MSCQVLQQTSGLLSDKGKECDGLFHLFMFVHVGIYIYMYVYMC